MKMTCALCGRDTEPFVMIGGRAIGPTCARKAGLMPEPKQKKKRFSFQYLKVKKQIQDDTLDLFDEGR